MGILTLIGAALLKGVLPGLATLAGGYAVALLHKLLLKQGISISREREAQLEKIIIDAILRTEEVARRDPLINSEEKEERTILDVQQATGGRYLWDEIRPMVDALLPLVRARLAGTAKNTEPTLGSR